MKKMRGLTDGGMTERERESRAVKGRDERERGGGAPSMPCGGWLRLLLMCLIDQKLSSVPSL